MSCPQSGQLEEKCWVSDDQQVAGLMRAGEGIEMKRPIIATTEAASLLFLAGASFAWAETAAPRTLEPPPQVPVVEYTATVSTPDPVPSPDPVAKLNQPDVGQCRRLAKVFFDLPSSQQSKTAGRLISCVEAVVGTYEGS